MPPHIADFPTSTSSATLCASPSSPTLPTHVRLHPDSQAHFPTLYVCENLHLLSHSTITTARLPVFSSEPPINIYPDILRWRYCGVYRVAEIKVLEPKTDPLENMLEDKRKAAGHGAEWVEQQRGNVWAEVKLAECSPEREELPPAVPADLETRAQDVNGEDERVREEVRQKLREAEFCDDTAKTIRVKKVEKKDDKDSLIKLSETSDKKEKEEEIWPSDSVDDLAASTRSIDESEYSALEKSEISNPDDSDRWSEVSTGPVDRQWTVVYEEKDEVV